MADESDTARRISTVVRRCVSDDDVSDWVLLLSDRDLLTRVQRKSLLKLEKEKNYAQVIRQSCEYVLSSKNKSQKLSEPFTDEELEEVDQKSKEIIQKLFQNGEISDERGWMIDSWDVLRASVELRQIALKLCSSISKDDWPLDFIHHIVTTDNSYTEGQFVQGAKTFLHSQQLQHDSGSSCSTERAEEDMEVDSNVKPNDDESRSHGSDMSVVDYQESYVAMSMVPSTFENLDSDGEVKGEDLRNAMAMSMEKSPAGSATFDPSASSIESKPPIAPSTTEDILQEVKPFETDSPTQGRSLDWEVVNYPDAKRKLSQGDGEEFKRSRKDHPETDVPFQAYMQQSATSKSQKSDLKQTANLQDSQDGEEERNAFNLSQNNDESLQSASDGYTEVDEKHPEKTSQAAISPQPFKPKPWQSLVTVPTQQVFTSTSGAHSLQPHDMTKTLIEAEDSGTVKPNHERRRQLPQTDTTHDLEAGDAAQKASRPIPTKLSHEQVFRSQEDAPDETAVPGHQEASLHKEDSSPVHTTGVTLGQESAHHTQGPKLPDEGEDKKPERQVSRTSSDTSEDSEEPGSLNWFTDSLEELKKYKFNIQMLVKLAWPKAKLIEESIWPYNLLSLLSEQSNYDQGFVDHFVSACRIVINKTEPLTEKSNDEKGNSGMTWLMSNSNLLITSKEDAVLLYQLTWPEENLPDDEEATKVLDKLFAKNKTKKQKSRLKDFSIAAKMLLEKSKKQVFVKKEGKPQQPTDSTTQIQQAELQQTKLKTDQPAANVPTPEAESLSGYSKDKRPSKSPGGTKVQKMKDMLGIGKKEKSNDDNQASQRKSKATPRPSEKNTSTKPRQTRQDEGNSANIAAKEKPKKNEKPTKNTPTSPKNQKEDKTENAQEPNNTEEFHDAVADLEDCVILKEGSSDDSSFEIRAVYDATKPEVTTLYVVENCWYDWRMIRMNYNRERNFYFISLPLKEGEFTFQYKYCLHVQGYNYVWEHLPCHNQFVNHKVVLMKSVQYLHDVPVFPFQFRNENMMEIIQRLVHLHLPPAKQHTAASESGEKHVSYKNEVQSWVSQVKNGWQTTDSYYRKFHISPQAFDIAMMKWLAPYLVQGSSEMDVLNRILIVLNAVVSLNKLNHRIHETKLLSFLCSGLNVQTLDMNYLKMLYHLIKQEFSAKGSSTCPVVRDALLSLYRQLPNILSSSSPWVEWILTLPLYWMVANGGEIKRKMALKKGGGFLHVKSALPEAEKLQWSEVRSKCKSDTSQRALMALSDKILRISAIHPWIVGSYLYMLSDQSLIQILKDSDKHEMARKFPIDSVFSSILKEWKNAMGKRQALDDVYSLRKYFDSTFEQIFMRDKESLTEDERMEQKDSAKNMLSLMLRVSADIILYSGEKQRNLLLFVKLTNNIAEWMRQILKVDERYDETRADVFVMLRVVCDKISKFIWMDEDEIKFIDTLFRTSWSDEKIQSRWVDLIKAEVKKLIKKKWRGSEEDFLEFYVKSAEKYQMEKHLEECIEEHAFKCTEYLLEDFKMRKSWTRTFWSTPRFVGLFGRLFKKEYEKVFSESSTEHLTRGPMKCLQFIVNWSFAPRFYQVFYKEKSLELLHEDVQRKAGFVEQRFRQAVTCFCSGRLKISESEYFIQNEKPILEFYSILILKTTGADVSVDDMIATHLSLRKSQLEAIKVSKRNLDTFISLCMGLEDDSHILVDVEELENLALMKDAMVYQVIDPKDKPLNPEKGLKQFEKVTEDIANEMHIINLVYNSKTFEKVWKTVLETESEKSSEEIKMSWNEVLDKIWATAKDRTFSVFKSVCDGSVAVSILAELFNFSKGARSMIANEIFSLAAGSIDNDCSDKLLEERCDQIQKILQLKKSEHASQLMMKLKTVLNLGGDFRCVQVIQSMEENAEVALKDVNLDINENFSDDLWADSKFLAILEKFAEQKDLISWLQGEMKDLSEVKVFCDLGMISAGETSYEVDRVSFFLSAVMGFGPLIFDMGKDAGLKEVMEKCRIVKNNADSDDKLIDKWTDTGRQLTWFEGIHKLHGSVGTQSLTLAQEVNCRGIYIISKTKQGTPTIENSLKLNLQPVEKKSQEEPREEEEERVEEKEKTENAANTVKFLSYDELKDLQSKLMLIAGEAEQGHQDVARFNDVLSAAANLSQGFINLINAGCLLFNNWSARVICSKDELIISLNFSDDIPPISTSSCLKDLELLVEVMNTALVQWTDYIDKMRQKHYYLNDYNIQQITYLCQKLAKSDFTDQIFSLLSDLRRIQVCDHMQTALDEATEVQEDEEIILEENVENENESLSIIEVKSRMVRELAKNGLDESLAKAAVQCEQNQDLEDCENWALLHQHDSDLIQDLSQDFDEEAGFGPETNKVQNYTSLLHNRMSITLKELITQIQGKEHESKTEMRIHSIVKTICMTYNDKTSKLTLQDSLSIDHLGKFLNILRQKLGDFGGRVDRDLLAPMLAGKANLILIPTGDMLYTTLSMYMRNENQPLPTKSEVLICAESTSEDEVGRFLRRAMCRNPRKEKRLFCMVFADKLTFNISTHVECLWNALSSRENLNPDYQLVILCGTNNQQHYLVTCFDRTRVELKLATNTEKIAEYLCNKLKAENSEEASVKLVSSKRSGVGKSLRVKRLIEQLDNTTHVTTIRLLQKTIDTDHVLARLYRKRNVLNEDAHLIHIDLTSAVESGIEEFAFNLFVLGSIQDSQGQIWRHHSQHLYAVEMTESKKLIGNSVLNLIPCTKCLSPKEVLATYESGRKNLLRNEILMDQQEFHSETFQRPFQYLKQYSAGSDLDKFHYVQPAGTEQECIAVLLNHCGMKNPSWAQLRYFSSFLNVQLVNCEESIFCKKIQGSGRQDVIEFRGLKAFAVYFMVKMAQDFATPSLRISDESTRDEKDALDHYTIRRRWEDEIHPFVFFNEDRVTMTFINVNVSDNGDLLKADGTVERRGMVSQQLVRDLKRQGVPFGQKFNTLSRKEKITILCQFMNIPREFDPDRTYELTTDNVLKMLAIYMRLRCEIPVIVMGETGCGKTRMIEFMSKMRSGQSKKAKNMVTLKIHGGIQVDDIYQSVKDAKEIAIENKEQHDLSTILFYDEANTTSAIYAIKEVVCDFSIDGEDFRNSQLQIVAACNPYKRLSDAAVEKLEASGLGYNTKASEAEQVGHVPMRRLVYRVVALPPSMQPFVWDFGQLGNEAEGIYIKQMTNHLKEELELQDADATLIHSVLFDAQCYMRRKCKDESRYVSLRDVERSLKTFRWFYQHSKHIFPDVIEHHKDKHHDTLLNLPRVLRCLLHTISICYHASLDDRISFRNEISTSLRRHSTKLTEGEINLEIIACQTIFTKCLKMDDNIACNEALRENVFLMTVCADLRIPLFVVGKPGSSKSLAKTIVGDNMQGKTSHSDLYKHFKQVHILSYQCSALTDAEGIESIFNQCAQLQSNQDTSSYAAVVVLDEIGLAEDSPNMPLKVLHPLLECGSTKNGTLTEFDEKRKVAFVGISNWALDPAKMNRGIFVTRSSPDEKDLKKTAGGIFENQKNKMNVHLKIIKGLTDAYLELYHEQKREYFGLRDYYSLIKMLHSTLKTQESLSQSDVERAIQRNFSGGEKSQLDMFQSKLKYKTPPEHISVQEMVKKNLEDDKSRFLLLLTNQYSSFSLLQNFITDFHDNVQVIFGSSFPNDHSYTEMCRNINRVKVCMETGRTVILLNMNEINESLYDALNQHYVTLGGQRYVDLGLGGHRVKCRIADGFRLIVIELKEKVYNEYPIPLINRLEKHHLTSNSLLSGKEKSSADEISEWVEKFSKVAGTRFTPSHAFLGHNEDSVSSVVISHKQDVEGCKEVILESATMDAVFRLPKTELGSENTMLLKTYVQEQIHDNLWLLLKSRMKDDTGRNVVLLEITTFSNILSDSDRKDLECLMECGPRSVMLLSLQQFQTEQDYLKKLDEFFNFCNKEPTNESASDAAVLLVQCPQAHKHTQLIACARYGLKNKLTQISRCRKKIVIALLLSTERKLTSSKSGREEGVLSLQHSSDCEIIYVDELRPTFRSFGQTSQFHGKTICDVLEIGCNSIHPNGEGDELGINMPTLLNDCICEAMAKVKSKAKNDQRNLECIQILCRICTENEEINYHFLKILTTKMIEIYQERQEEIFETEDWIVKEACSAEKLQEGGTFAKTLWLCLKNHVSHLLAYIVALIDADDNLSILADTGQKSKRVHNMWMEMFKACKVKWEDMRGRREFVTQGKPYQADGEELRIPFCFLINRSFEDQWLAVKTERGTEKRKMFFNLFCSSNSKMNDAITEALKLQKPMDLVNAFARNLIKINYASDVQCDSKLSEALVNIATLLFHKLREEKEMPGGSHWFLILFYCLKDYQSHLKIVNDIINLCPQSTEKMTSWIEEIQSTKSVMIHKKALEFALQSAKEKALQIKDAGSCCDWMNFTRRLRTIFDATMVLLKKDADRQGLLLNWESLAMLDLLFLHLLPNPSQEDAFKKYVEVIASHAKLLYKGTSKSGIRGQQFLRIVCNVLRKYYEDVKLKVFLNWQNSQCRICRKVCKTPTILPCGHYFCCPCLKSTLVSSQEQKKCFSCSAVLPDDYEPVPTVLTQAQNREVKSFRSHCTSFFLEYLSKFVLPFPKTLLGQEDVIQLVLEELLLNNDESQKTELEKTGLDLNIATKTNILSILFGYTYREVENLVNEFLAGQQDAENIVLVILKHFEQLNMQRHHATERKQLITCSRLLKRFSQRVTGGDTTLSLQFLEIIAGARYGILQFVKAIHENAESDEDEIETAQRDTLLYNIKSVITSDDSEALKEYFVKVGCRTFGMEWFADILQNKSYKDLIPESLKNTNEMNAIDYFTSLGASYSDMRSNLSKTAIANHKEKLSEWFPQNHNFSTAENFMKILAVTTWLQDHQRQKGMFKDHFQSLLAENVELLDSISSVIDDTKKLTNGATGISRQQKSMLDQMIPLIAGVIKLQPAMMNELRMLMDDPSKVAQMFWPGMPESFYFSMPQELRCENGQDAMYQCPNGHYYTIGQCTKPWTISRCPDCRAPIGGKGHIAQSGNQRVQKLEESSQTGYMLRSTDKNLQCPEDRISLQATSVIQLLIHTSMLIGIRRKPASVTQILPSPDAHNAAEYLLGQILGNIQNLAKSIGRNVDETILLLCKIMLNILEIKVASGSATANSVWTSITSRKDWEIQFRTTFLLPVFQQIDNAINKAQQNLNAAEDMSSIALFRVVCEVKDEERELHDGREWWKNPCPWHIIEHPNANHLMQSIRDNPSQETGGVLRTILETPDLELLKYLDDVLSLQRSMIERYQNKIDLGEAEKTTIHSFFTENPHAEGRVKKYVQAWNEMRHMLRNNGECDQQMQTWFEQEISEKSPISNVLPSTRGRGRCAKLLAEHLVEIQNRFLLKCFEIVEMNASENEVEASNLSPSHLVRIDKHADLLPLIYLHTSYTVSEDGHGRHHYTSYNTDALEKQARENFIKNKKLIVAESLPSIKYTQDVGIGTDWDKVMANTKLQEPLSPKLMQTVDELVASVTPAEVCEGVRTLTYAISFLAKVECEPSRMLHEYLEKDLLLAKTRTAVLPRFAKIYHTLALYQHLTWHKAVNFVQQGLQPYQEALYQVNQEQITDTKVLRHVKDAFEHMDVIVFQQHLNEMLIKVPDYEEEWSLADDIFPNLQFIGNEATEDTWFEKIPPEICFKHVSHLFELAVNHVQNAN